MKEKKKKKTINYEGADYPVFIAANKSTAVDLRK